MGRRKRAKVHVKTGEKNDPPDKKKKVPVQDKMSEVEDETATPDKEQRSVNVEGNHAGSASPSQKKSVKRNQRVLDYEDEDWLPESEGSDCSSVSERDENMSLSDEEELSSEEGPARDNGKRKAEKAAKLSPSKRLKKGYGESVLESTDFNNKSESGEDEDEDSFAIIPDDYESSSKSEEEDPEPEPQRQLRGTRYVKIRNNVWKIILVRGDGNCLFYTLAYLLGRTPQDHHQIRVDIVRAAITPAIWKEIAQDVRNKLFSRPEFHQKTDEELKQLYCNMMIKDGVYASDIEMRVASKLFSFKITYIEEYTDLQPNQNKYRVCDVAPQSDKPIKWIRYSGSYEHGHFEPLHPVGEIEPLRDGGYDDARYFPTKTFSKKFEANKTHSTPNQEKKVQYKKGVKLPLKCDELLCPLLFEDATKYLEHLFAIHGRIDEIPRKEKESSSKFPCPILKCKAAPMPNAKQRLLHFKINHFDNLLVCPERNCGRAFNTKGNLNKHLITHKKRNAANTSKAQNNDSVNCQFKDCKKKFTDPKPFMEHFFKNHSKRKMLKEEGKETRYPCPHPDCSKRVPFSSSDQRFDHFKITHFDKLTMCPKVNCGKLFKSSQKLKRHLLLHDNENYNPKKQMKHGGPTNCVHAECPEVFYKSNDYLNHFFKKHGKDEIINEDGIPLYPCPYPGCELQKAESVQSRSLHFRTVHYCKQLKCYEPNCGKLFQTKKKLEDHIRHHNSIAKENTHMRIENPDDIKKCCEDGCNEKFTKSSDFLYHLFDKHGKLEEERNPEGELVYPCPFRGCRSKHFVTMDKRRNHFFDCHFRKKIQCPASGCVKKFIKQSELNIHFLTHHDKEQRLKKPLKYLRHMSNEQLMKRLDKQKRVLMEIDALTEPLSQEELDKKLKESESTVKNIVWEMCKKKETGRCRKCPRFGTKHYQQKIGKLGYLRHLSTLALYRQGAKINNPTSNKNRNQQQKVWRQTHIRKIMYIYIVLKEEDIVGLNAEGVWNSLSANPFQFEQWIYVGAHTCTKVRGRWSHLTKHKSTNLCFTALGRLMSKEGEFEGFPNVRVFQLAAIEILPPLNYKDVETWWIFASLGLIKILNQNGKNIHSLNRAYGDTVDYSIMESAVQAVMNEGTNPQWFVYDHDQQTPRNQTNICSIPLTLKRSEFVERTGYFT